MNLVLTVQRVLGQNLASRHTSTATVVMPEAEEVEIELEDKDICVDIYHASVPVDSIKSTRQHLRTFNALANRYCCSDAR